MINNDGKAWMLDTSPTDATAITSASVRCRACGRDCTCTQTPRQVYLQQPIPVEPPPIKFDLPKPQNRHERRAAKARAKRKRR